MKIDDVVPIHLFAKGFFEKELKGQQRLDEERSLWKGRSTIQWNPRNADTFATHSSVLIKGVSSFQRLFTIRKILSRDRTQFPHYRRSART